MSKYIFVILATVICAACSNVSFESKQFDFVKRLLKGPPQDTSLGWKYTWGELQGEISVINYKTGFSFVNDAGFFANFNGSHISTVSIPTLGSRKNIAIETVESSDPTIKVRFKDETEKLFALHDCSTWQAFSSEKGAGSRLEQKCVAGAFHYSNEIFVNQMRQVVALRFLVLPETAQLKIWLRDAHGYEWRES